MAIYPIIENPVLPNEMASKKGVYVIYAINKNNIPKPIKRVLGIDNKGIMYIGMTNKQSFKDRIDMFKRVMNKEYKATAHSGALNLKHIEALRNQFPPDCIYVEVIPNKNPKKLEQMMIEEYRQEFGEVPPLNGSK